MVGASLCSLCQEKKPIIVGSKKFTESYVLGEIAKKLLGDAGFTAEHQRGIGSTTIVWEALKSGAVDVYPEYTGTVKEAILKIKGEASDEDLAKSLASFGVGMSRELGFNNTYALVMRRKQAEQLGIKTMSDLRSHPDLRVKVSSEFLNRPDGWPSVVAKYGLKFEDVTGVDHSIGYTALASGQIDITDAYSTDAQIGTYDLYTLQDDLQFFPKYKAVYLYRLNLPPNAVDALNEIAGKIDEPLMVKLNGEAEKTKSYSDAAKLFFSTVNLTSAGGSAKHSVAIGGESMWRSIGKNTARHLQLVGISLLIAILVGIPLGIAASKPGWTGQTILGITGAIQTIPALALLALLVPIKALGLSMWTAIIALFLYSLLPIVRNTASGLQDIPPALRESAAAIGLEPFARLTKIFLPMASRSILTGIKTSAIINIGTATLAALIGQGGLGDPIISGLDLVDTPTILQGAIPAAVLALLVGWVFDLLDRVFIPKGLRLASSH